MKEDNTRSRHKTSIFIFDSRCKIQSKTYWWKDEKQMTIRRGRGEPSTQWPLFFCGHIQRYRHLTESTQSHDLYYVLGKNTGSSGAK